MQTHTIVAPMLCGALFFNFTFTLHAAVAKAAIKPTSTTVKATKTKTPTKAAPKATANAIKGQGQIAAANGQFQEVYSLKTGFNFSILSARYSVEPFRCNSGVFPNTDEKLLVLAIAIKNIKPEDNWFSFDELFVAVDAHGGLYQQRDTHLLSSGGALVDMTLRPGQGLGQSELNNPLEVVFRVPATARIVKIMVNQGRVTNPEEKAVRYYIAGAKKSEAGEDGHPKNIIAPLPASVRDTADQSGAIALAEGKGVLGVYGPSGAFALRLDQFNYSVTETVDGNLPEERKKYAIATITAKNLLDQTASFFEVQGGDNPLYSIVGTDNELVAPFGYRKAKKDEVPELEFKFGTEYTFRVVFQLSADIKAKSLIIGANNGRKWAIDVTTMGD